MKLRDIETAPAAYGVHPGPPPERRPYQSATVDYSAINEAINETLGREFSCSHPRTRLCVTVSVRGSRTYRNKCLRCGETTSNERAADLPECRKAAAVEFDDLIRRRWWESRSERYQQLRSEAQAEAEAQAQVEEERLRGEDKDRWDRWYRAYLASAAWRARRAAVLRRDGGLCQGCLTEQATQVHHLTYEHVGYELLFELMSVCDACHRRIHPGKP